MSPYFVPMQTENSPKSNAVRTIRYTRNLRIAPRYTPTLTQCTVTLVVLGLVWRGVRYALGFPIWGDESFVAVNFVRRDYWGMLDPLIYGQIVPLVFMWIELAVSRVLGLSEWALRLVPWLAGVIAVPLFWRFARDVLPRRAVLLAVGLFACGYYLVRHSVEVKPYSLDALLALGLIMLTWGVVQRPQSVVRWAALIALGLLSPWCSYPSVFVGGAAGLTLTALLVQRRFDRRIIVGWALFGVALCGSFAVMYVVYAKPHADAAARLLDTEMWSKAFPPMDAPWKLPAWLVAIHTGRMFAYPQGGNPPGSLFTAIMFFIGCAVMWRRQRLLLLLLAGPLPLALAAAMVKAYPYGTSARTMLYLAPAVCLLAGLGWFATMRRLLPGEQLRAGLLISAIVLAAFPIAGMIGDVREPYRSDSVLRSKQAVLDVVAQTDADDRWVIYNADRKVAHAPYLGDWWGVGGQFVFDALRFAPVPLDWSPPAEQVVRPPGDLWLLVYYAQHPKADFPEPLLDDYLAVLAGRFGPPVHERHVIKHDERKGKFEALDVYRFATSTAATRPSP